MRMKHRIAVALLATLSLLPFADAEAARVRVVKTHTARGTRTRVTVTRGFPLHRTLPNVVVRGPVVRVAPRVYLTPVAFAAVAVATLPPANVHAWSGAEVLEREDGWTDFTLDVDRRGSQLLLDVERGAAQISFAEVVFDNGETQVVDFNDHVHRTGIYSLLDFRNGRKVDHVRIVAKADTSASEIRMYLVS
jgi:hypothetical protein